MIQNRVAFWRTLIVLIGIVAIIPLQVHGETKPFNTKAKQAYLIEADTGTVLFSKNDNELIAPASLAKLMTAEVIFNEVREGRLSLDTEFPVSEFAWRTGGALSRSSTMFAELDSTIKVNDLLQGLIIQSANDGAIVLAEGVSGSEAAFAQNMTRRARSLGMEKSIFANSSGLPHPDNKVTVRELALLARHIQQAYPEYFKFYSQPDFEWNKIRQRNRNPLLALNIGVDGMKTGFIEDSGFAIVATIKRDEVRLFLVMSGLTSTKERADEAQKMLEWGLENFERRTIFKAGEKIANASVYGGQPSSVAIIAKTNVDIFVPINNPARIRANVLYHWPLNAPIAKDQIIGLLQVYIGDSPINSVKLYAAGPVEPGPLASRALDGLKELLFFWL